MGEGLEFGDFKVEDEFVENTVPETVSIDEDPVVDEAVEVPAESELEEILGSEDLTEEQRRQLLDEYFPLPDDFPSREELKAMEEEHGRIRMHRIAPKEAYVVRALTRAEFRQYLAILKSKFSAGTADPAEERMVQEELLVERCTLWPKITGADIRGESRPLHKVGLAGTASILALDIQEISNLIDTNVGPFEEL